jgi:hypothetical protein
MRYMRILGKTKPGIKQEDQLAFLKIVDERTASSGGEYT